MLRLLFQHDDRISCDESDTVTESFCSDYSVYAYQRMYSIIIGDLGIADYQQSFAVTTLFILFTFFGLIVMLNVLIAGKS